jgi:hypothetical protein
MSCRLSSRSRRTAFGLPVLLGLTVLLTAAGGTGIAAAEESFTETGCNTCLALDVDGDGLSAGEEQSYGTNPNLFDTDGDQLGDGAEVADWYADPLVPDTDGDGILDGVELDLGTFLATYDSDGDGLRDGTEVYSVATNPLNYDTDGDSYTDYDELFVYNTLPQIYVSHP